MISLAQQNGMEPRILNAVDDVNEVQKEVLFNKIHELTKGNLSGKTIAVWGLSFKPRTDDIREAPALVLIDSLLKAGCKVRTHDPKAMANVKEIYGDNIVYCDRAFSALEGADLLAIVTEWQEFRNPDFSQMKKLMKNAVIVDGRNLYEPATMKEQGFTYLSIGRKSVLS